MKYRTSELTGAFLDAAVAVALGRRFVLRNYHGDGCSPVDKCELFIDLASGESRTETFAPSWKWDHGGPIIERERIEWVIESQGPANQWQVRATGGMLVFGATPLIAAMRSFVSRKIGAEVEL